MDTLPRGEHVRRDARFIPLVAGRMARRGVRRVLSILALVAIDVAGVFLGIMVALAVKLAVEGESVDLGAIWLLERKVLPLAAVVVVLTFTFNRLYVVRERRGHAFRIIGSVAIATVVVAALLIASGERFNSYYAFYGSWIFVSILIIALRASYDSITGLMLEAMNFERRALIVGPEDLVDDVAEILGHSDGRRDAAGGVPYRVVARHELVAGVDRDDVNGAAGALRAALDPASVDEVIVAGWTGADAPVLDLLEACRRRGIPVRLAPTAAELLSHSVRAVPAPGLPLFELRPPVLSGLAFSCKRAFDVVVGAVLLALASPLIGISALAIKLEDRGPVFFRSRRVGVDEAVFECIKLRTMRTGAEAEQPALEAANEADGALFKIRDDPRVTRTGRILRRFSVDELPQLVNVLRGEMSLVGPRPLPERDFQLLDALQRKRYLVLPGMTGLWQVSGRSELSFDELIRLDFSYIESWSIWLDLAIMARTVKAVLWRRGAW